MSSVPQVVLNSKRSIPAFAFGTATVRWQKPCAEHVLSALKAGFRDIDTAQEYNNQTSVGIALAQWGGKREDDFITTKWGQIDRKAPNDPRQALLDASKEMEMDYVDLFLMHRATDLDPYTFVEGWTLMESLQQESLCREIGVSNFGATDMKQLSERWKVVPAVNSIELWPYSAHDPRTAAILATCKAFGIKVMPYAILHSLYLSTNGPVDDVVRHISEKTGMSEAQVLWHWAWAVTEGGPLVTTSDKVDKMEQCLETFDYPPLTQQEVDQISEAGRGRSYRYYTDLCRD